MDRDKQIELLRTAQARRQGHLAAWLRDDRVRASLKKNREFAERQKGDAKRAHKVG